MYFSLAFKAIWSSAYYFAYKFIFPFCREQKNILSGSSKPGSHDIGLGSNLVVTGKFK